jgi:type III secretion protein D
VAEQDLYTFEVESGLYAGLRSAAAEGTFTIGSGTESDIVLMERGFDQRHFSIELSGSSARLEAYGENVSIIGTGSLAAGETRKAPLPVTVSIGDVRLRWSANRPEPAPANHLTTWALAATAFVALAIVGLVIFYNSDARATLVSDQKSGRAAVGEAVNESHFVEDTTPRIVLRRTSAETTFAAEEALRAEIEKAGLLNISLQHDSGMITADGSVEPNAVARWRHVQEWFDHRFNGAPALVNGVNVKAEKLPASIAVEAIWHGVQPHVLVRGQKYFVGAVLDNGWTIDRIETDRLLLRRDGRLAAVRY